ncbi:MAG TPA: hypothetical protein VIL49_12995 [Capillimicrobium sp.]|jgi:hypothetical protein
MRSVLASLLAFAALAAPAAAASPFELLVPASVGFATDGVHHVAWGDPAGGRVTVLNTRTGERRTVPGSEGCGASLYSRDLVHEGTVPSLWCATEPHLRTLDLSALTVAPAPGYEPAPAPVSPCPAVRRVPPTDGDARRYVAVGDRAALIFDGSRLDETRRWAVSLRRCDGRTVALGTTRGEAGSAWVGGGWAVWDTGIDGSLYDPSYERLDRPAVHAVRVRDLERVTLRLPRTGRELCGRQAMGAFGQPVHTASHVFWVEQTSFVEDKLCFETGPSRVWVAPLRPGAVDLTPDAPAP